MKRKLIPLVLVLAAVVLAVIILCTRKAPTTGGTELGGTTAAEMETLPAAEETDTEGSQDDAEAYFRESGEILGVLRADQSPDVQSEEQAVAAFAERGFTQTAPCYNYDMTGKTLDLTPAGASAEKHPMYQCAYETAGGNVWYICCINGSFSAYAAFYGQGQGYTVPVLMTEGDGLWSYDGLTNRFFHTRQNGREAVVIRIDAVNSEALEGLAKEAIDSLCALKTEE